MTFLQDLRYALRSLKNNPGFAAVAILSLALGMGANTAIFSLLNSVMLRTLPVSKPEELSVLRTTGARPGPQRYSYPLFQRLQQAAPDPGSMAAMSRVARVLTITGNSREAEAARMQLVSGEYFQVLGIHAAMGRVITPDDNRVLGGHPLAVISYGYWQRRFGGSPAALGSAITVNGARLAIGGVAQKGFSGLWADVETDLWVPLMMQSEVRYRQNYSDMNGQGAGQPWPPQEQIWWLDIVARDGARGAGLEARLNPVFQREPGREANALALEPCANGFSTLRPRFSAPLVVLMGMVGVVLLICCANVANLLMARAAARSREVAVRLSIGASRARIIRQLLTESLALALLGSVAGLLAGVWTSMWLARMALGMTSTSGPLPFSIGLDARVLGFTAAVCVVTAVFFGLAPAFRATRVDLNAALKSGSRAIPGSGGRSGRWLVAAQVALSLVLLVGAGLFLRSLRHLSSLNPGYDREHVISVRINPHSGGFKLEQLPALYRGIIDSVEALPGVRSAALSICPLATGCVSTSSMTVEGYASRPGEDTAVQYNVVGLKYFSTVGIQLLQGRDFDARDTGQSPRVAVVSEAMARRFFGSGTALGRRFGPDKADIEIVGIVRDARVNNLRDQPPVMAFFPLSQIVAHVNNLDVRASGDPNAIAATLRRTVVGVDPRLPVDRVVPLAEQLDNNLNQERLVARLTSAFGALALILACVGLYGVMSYAVARRTPEFAIRMALGSSQGRVLAAVMRESTMLVAWGLAVGVPLVLGGGRFLRGMLYGLDPNDPLTLAASCALLAAIGTFSGFLPARRASQVDPMTALRDE